MSDPSKPVPPLDAIIHALYSYTVEHQEALVQTASFMAALLQTLYERDPGFESAYKEKLNSHSLNAELQPIFLRLEAMQEGLLRVRRELGLHPDGSPA